MFQKFVRFKIRRDGVDEFFEQIYLANREVILNFKTFVQIYF